MHRNQCVFEYARFFYYGRMREKESESQRRRRTRELSERGRSSTPLWKCANLLSHFTLSKEKKKKKKRQRYI